MSSTHSLDQIQTMCNQPRGRRRSLLEAEYSINFSDYNYPNFESPMEPLAPVKMEDVSSESEASSAKPKREIQHNYHDHASDDGAIYRDVPVVSKGGVTVPFPMKLHNMLEHISLNDPTLAEIVSWQPHGRCFLVKDIKTFTSDVLPRFFQQRKYASFQRQLNLYGFNRITKGPDRGSYYHELFLRSKQILCRGIQRMKVKGTGSRMASNPKQEPNFYLMQVMPPSAPVKNEINDDVKIDPKPLPPLMAPPQPMPQAMICKEEPLTQEENDHLNYVFGNMPFHELETDGESRRHSLMDYARRLSMSFRRHSSNDQNKDSTNESLRRSSILSRQSSIGSTSGILGRRRSSLFGSFMNGARRLSMQFGNRRNSVFMVDDQFNKEMDAIAQLGEKDLSDQEFGNMLDKIVDHRVL